MSDESILFSCQYDGSNLVPVSSQNFDSQSTHVKTVVQAWLDSYSQELIAPVNSAVSDIKESAKNFVYAVKMTGDLVSTLKDKYDRQLVLDGQCFSSALTPARDSAVEMAKDLGGVLVEQLADKAIELIVAAIPIPGSIIVAETVNKVAGAYVGIIAKKLYDDSKLEALFGDLGGELYDSYIAIERVINDPSVPSREVYTLVQGKEAVWYRETCLIFDGVAIYPTAIRRGVFVSIMTQQQKQIVVTKYNNQAVAMSQQIVPDIVADYATLGAAGIVNFEDKSLLILYKIVSPYIYHETTFDLNSWLAVARLNPSGDIEKTKILATGTLTYSLDGIPIDGSIVDFGTVGGGVGVNAFCYYRTSYDRAVMFGRAIADDYILQSFSPTTLELSGESISRDWGDARNPHCYASYGCGTVLPDVFSCSGLSSSSTRITLADQSEVSVEYNAPYRLIHIKTPVMSAVSPFQKIPVIMPGSSSSPFATVRPSDFSLPTDSGNALICLDPTFNSRLQLTSNPNSMTFITGFGKTSQLDFSAFTGENQADMISRVTSIPYNDYLPQDFFNGLVPIEVLYGHTQQRRRQVNFLLSRRDLNNSSVNSTSLVNNTDFLNDAYTLLQLPNNQTLVFMPISEDELIQVIQNYYFINMSNNSASNVSNSSVVLNNFNTSDGMSSSSTDSLALSVIISSVVVGSVFLAVVGTLIFYRNSIMHYLKMHLNSKSRANTHYRPESGSSVLQESWITGSTHFIPRASTLSAVIAMGEAKYLFQKQVAPSNDGEWSCQFLSGDEMHCMELHSAKQRIVSRLNATPWSDIQGDNYYHCESFEKDGIPTRQCMGENTEMVELDIANRHVSVQQLSVAYQFGSSALMGAAFTAVPEAIGDTLHLSGLLSEENAVYVKHSINAGLIVATGSWLSVVVSIATTTILQQLGCSESKARMAGNTVAFIMNLIKDLTPIGVASGVANYAGARLGLWGEKKAARVFSGQLFEQVRDVLDEAYVI